MKKIITVLLITFSVTLISCGQDQCGYSQPYVDNLNAQISSLQNEKNDLLRLNTECSLSKNNLVLLNDKLTLEKVQISNKCTNTTDSLQRIINLKSVFMFDTNYVVRDSIYFVIGDSSMTILVDKKGATTKVKLIDNNHNRVMITQEGSVLSFWVQSDIPIGDSLPSFTRFSSHLDLRKD